MLGGARGRSGSRRRATPDRPRGPAASGEPVRAGARGVVTGAGAAAVRRRRRHPRPAARVVAAPRRRPGSPATCPKRVARRRWPTSPAASGTGSRRPAPRRPGGTSAASLRSWIARAGRGPAPRRGRADDPRELERLVRLAFRHDARYYLEILRVPGLTPGVSSTSASSSRPRTEVDEAFDGGPVIFVVGPLRADRAAGALPRPAVRPDVRRPDGDRRRPGAPGAGSRRRGARSASGSSASGRRGASCSAALAAAATSGSSPTGTSRGGGIEVPFFGAPAPFPIGPALLADRDRVPRSRRSASGGSASAATPAA